MMLASVYGRLGQDPRSIETKSGKPMCVSSMAVELQDRQGEATTQWVGIVAFARQADTLAKHSKGDLLAVSGRVQTNTWTNSEGQAQTQLQIVADSIISARAARPGGRRASSVGDPGDAGGTSTPSGVQPPADFDDSVPF
jgi:single stranded DNA-binding protein